MILMCSSPWMVRNCTSLEKVHHCASFDEVHDCASLEQIKNCEGAKTQPRTDLERLGVVGKLAWKTGSECAVDMNNVR